MTLVILYEADDNMLAGYMRHNQNYYGYILSAQFTMSAS